MAVESPIATGERQGVLWVACGALLIATIAAGILGVSTTPHSGTAGSSFEVSAGNVSNSALPKNSAKYFNFQQSSSKYFACAGVNRKYGSPEPDAVDSANGTESYHVAFGDIQASLTANMQFGGYVNPSLSITDSGDVVYSGSADTGFGPTKQGFGQLTSNPLCIAKFVGELSPATSWCSSVDVVALDLVRSRLTCRLKTKTLGW